MKTRKAPQISLIMIFAVTLIAGLGAFYLHQLRSDISHHSHFVEIFHQFYRVHAELNENILKSRSFNSQTYDPIVKNTSELSILCERIRNEWKSLAIGHSSQFESKADQFCDKQDNHFSLVENFKSKNSVFKNSLKYLRILVNEYKSTPHGKQASDIYLSILNNAFGSSAKDEKEIQSRIEKLDTHLKNHGEVGKAFRDFTLHANLTLQANSSRNAIVAQLLSREAKTEIQAFERVYLDDYTATQRKTAKYRRWIVAGCVGLFGIVIFLSLRLREMAVSLRELNQNLEQKVKDRTEELSGAMESLAEKQQMLNQATKMSALGEMAGGVAHEINTPLTSILITAELMLMKLDQAQLPELKRESDTIIQTVKRISSIVQGLRKFSRSNGSDAKSFVLVEDLIQDTLSFCQEKFKNNGVGLKIKPSPKDFKIYCVEEQVSQVLLNLLNNSFDAVISLPEKWIEIEIVETEMEKEIWVSDSGSGISPALQEKIMQPFFTTKAIGKGTGLGLSISQGIMAAQGGQLVYNPNSTNTQFRLIFPKVAEEPLAA